MRSTVVVAAAALFYAVVSDESMFPLLSSSIFIVAIVVDDGSSIANQLLLFTLSPLIVNVRVMCCDFIRLMYTLHVYVMSRMSQIKTYLVEMW